VVELKAISECRRMRPWAEEEYHFATFVHENASFLARKKSLVGLVLRDKGFMQKDTTLTRRVVVNPNTAYPSRS
jgi:hypothetical protein